MRLEDAIPIAERAAKRMSGKEAVALHVLVAFCKKAKKLRGPLREVAAVFDPDTHLNQQGLFKEDP